MLHSSNSLRLSSRLPRLRRSMLRAGAAVLLGKVGYDLTSTTAPTPARTPLQRFRQAALAVRTAVRLFRHIRRRRAAITQLLARSTNSITAQIRHAPTVALLTRVDIDGDASTGGPLGAFAATPALNKLVGDALRGRLQRSAERTRSLAWKLFLGVLPPYLAPADWEASLAQSRARYNSLLAKHAAALTASEDEYERRAKRESMPDAAAADAASQASPHAYPFWFADLVKDLPRIRLMVTTTHELARTRRSYAERAARRAARASRTSSTIVEEARDEGEDGVLVEADADVEAMFEIDRDDALDDLLIDADDVTEAMSFAELPPSPPPTSTAGGEETCASPSPRPLQTRNAFGSDETKAKMKRILFVWTMEHADGDQADGALGYVQDFYFSIYIV